MTLEQICIISDLHSNYEALRTVMQKAEECLKDEALTDRITALRLRRDIVEHEYQTVHNELTKLERNKDKYETVLRNFEESLQNQKKLSQIQGALKRATKDETKKRLRKEQKRIKEREQEIRVRYEQLQEAKVIVHIASIRKEADDKASELKILEQQLAREKQALPTEVKYISLGDNIGYGSDPTRVLDTLIDLKEQGRLIAALMGNHEQYLLSLVDSQTYEEYKARRQMLRQGKAFIGEGIQSVNLKAGNAIIYTYDKLFGQPEIIEADLADAIKNALRDELKKYQTIKIEELENIVIALPKEKVVTEDLRNARIKTYDPDAEKTMEETVMECINRQLNKIKTNVRNRDAKSKEAIEQLEKLKKSLEDGSLIEKAIKKAQETTTQLQEEAYQAHRARVQASKYYTFLKKLTYTYEKDGILFVHSHPVQPERMAYVWEGKTQEALASLPEHVRAVALGHNHTQFESEHNGKKVYSVGALGEHRRNSNAPRYAMMKNGQITFPQPPQYNWQKEEQQQTANGLIITDRKAGKHWTYSGQIKLTQEQIDKGEFKTSFTWQQQ